MLYQLYETQRAMMAPFAEFASASAKLYSHPLSPFTHTPMAQRVAAASEKRAKALGVPADIGGVLLAEIPCRECLRVPRTR